MDIETAAGIAARNCQRWAEELDTSVIRASLAGLPDRAEELKALAEKGRSLAEEFRKPEVNPYIVG